MSSLPVYNHSSPNGGDAVTVNVNVYDPGHVAWIIVSSLLVWLMIPAVGFLYAGLTKCKSSLTMLSQTLVTTAVITVQWYFWGFSLTFSHTAGLFIGDLRHIGMHNVLAAPSVASPLIPEILFVFYHLMFAVVTAVLAFGAIMERGRLRPAVLITFIWATVVYSPIACWTWNPSGWIAKLGALDFAGGGPVHMNSGFSGLAYSLMLGSRDNKRDSKRVGSSSANAPSVLLVFIGTVLLWFGWYGFNGGSALGSNVRAVYACINTNIAAAVGGLSCLTLDRFAGSGKWSLVSMCCGVVAGLVGITPAAGFVPVWAAYIIGFVTASVCWSARRLKSIMGVDDGLDIFAIHGIGGFVGCLMTGIFAADYVAATDGITAIRGGWISGHFEQLAYQLAGAIATAAYSFIVTLGLAAAVDRFVPGMQLRHSAEDEQRGLDIVELGETIWPEEFVCATAHDIEKVGENNKRFISRAAAIRNASFERPRGSSKQGSHIERHHNHTTVPHAEDMPSDRHYTADSSQDKRVRHSDKKIFQAS